MQHSTRWTAVLAALMAFSLRALPSAAAETDSPWLTSGPRTLIITANVAPGARPALRKLLETRGVQQFAKWQRDGVLESYHLLFNRNVETDTWDLITLVTFPRYTDITRWNEIEKTHPAGLPLEAARLLTAVHTTSVDLARSGAVPKPPGSHGKSVFKLIPYNYMPETPEYVAYLDGYVIPQVKGWQEAGVLASYNIYVARYQTDRPWNALFVLEYNDEESLGKREQTMAQVRARLRETNPEWKALSERKQNIRQEKRIVLTEEITP
jgi:hypothetical protein